VMNFDSYRANQLIERWKYVLHRVPYLLENLSKAWIGNESMMLGLKLIESTVGKRVERTVQEGGRGMVR
jgi:hypothetical protein